MGVYSVLLFWYPGYSTSIAGMEKPIELPFVPHEGMAIEMRESEGCAATRPYIESVTWNIERSRFECFIEIRFGEDVSEQETHDALLRQGWSEVR